MNRTDILRRKDINHFWHPYTDINSFERREFPVIEHAEGVYLEDTAGNRLLDGISSWWCMNLGHSHPDIVDAIRKQSGRLQNSITAGMSHTEVIRLSEKIADIAPGNLSRVYYASDGACSVEAAMRISLQYWWNLDRPEKRRMISLSGGYHGDTLGCAGLGYISGFHKPVEHVLNRSITADSPHCFHCIYSCNPEDCGMECFASMEKAVIENCGAAAAVIVEPVCQGAAGMRIYPPLYLSRLKKLCDENEVLLILDEIAVGFGRTGRMFASELAEIVPDMMCIGKGLTGGSLPMSAVVASEEVYDAFRSDSQIDRTFYHGHTFCGNPIAAAAACAAIDVYERDNVLGNVEILAKMLLEAFGKYRDIPGIHGSTALGCMSALEISEESGGASTALEIADTARRKGLFIRPLGPVLYLWPPLVTANNEMAKMLQIFEDSLIENLS
ncbi:MAG: adenosylmethionine--8-amino-7-oxononanoate transaminase [Candidatus Aegiribacteria sp.]|nr:adenosylmethionine--8-amino-7-oxononanoate transaminase [Candidatus Aegiribacteria sp.]